MHLTPANLPNGMPGIGELMDGYMQHAPHFGRHSMGRGWVFGFSGYGG